MSDPQAKRTPPGGRQRTDWGSVLDRARAILAEYETGVTLRQLFYRLVADGSLRNVQTYYRRLSNVTAVARRAGTFPDLLDRTSRIERYLSFDGAGAAREHIRDVYRRDRTEGQEWSIYLGVEKAGISEQLADWFTKPFGIPHVALGGFASQTLCDHVRRDIERQGRPAVLVYAGDLDPSGMLIGEDFAGRVGTLDAVERVALSPEQVTEYALIKNPDPEAAAKVARDPRAAAFRHRFGELVQYEVDALWPETLRDLYRTAIDDYWDEDIYRDVIGREAEEREALS
jgi:hypothetical protein